ncbi:glycosyltransferase [Paraburkholderia sp. CNPSo 3076]|uniref:glycosyltransferase n=1 Tax=Paraburkholderia sp. CNPSo 3076 TaxID=2940936 RepID=UPI00225A9EC3|nr:glycosyltransferase [Paraburkholderia sp. CNPSo 3076]MCX5539970.1 glycosyltransferase [Paraburkholderia sp. CNPSo 3076]
MTDATRTDGSSRDCILFSTADWDEPYWTNKQHTACALARRGWRVLYVESPGLRAPRIASGKDWKRIARRLWSGLRSNFLTPPRRDANVWVLSPLMIPAGHHWPAVRRLNQWLLRHGIVRFARQHRFSDPVIWTYHPFMLDAIGALPHGPVVYHCVDDLAAIPGVDVGGFNAAQQQLLTTCDAVFTTAQALREKCELYNSNTHFFANVVDTAHFGRALDAAALVPPEVGAIAGPRVVYHGVLSDFKVDFALIFEAARQRPDWSWFFIGEEREGQRSEWVARLKALPNVHFLGYRRYEELPDYLRGMQVGLLPTLLNDYTRSMFPMKFFEYLAAGLPVVSTPLDFTSGQFDGLEVGATPEAFVASIERQLRRGRLSQSEALACVGDNTWDARVDRMLERVSRGAASSTCAL